MMNAALSRDDFDSRRGRLPQARVGDVMRREFVAVSKDTEVEAVRDLFVDAAICGAPVIDEESRPVGFVSASDLLAVMWSGKASTAPGATRRRVEEIMMPFAFCVREETLLSQTAGLMAAEGIHRLPVTSPRGRLVGVVTSSEIMRWLAELDGFSLGAE